MSAVNGGQPRRLRDVRLLPIAAATWIGAWMGTSGAIEAAVLPIACIALGGAAAMLGHYFRGRHGMRYRPQHASAHAGSIRVAAAAILAAASVALSLGHWAKYTRDDDILAGAHGSAVSMTVRLTSDPQPRPTTWAPRAWTAHAQILTVTTGPGPPQASQSRARILLRSAEAHAFARGDRLRVVGTVDTSWSPRPEALGVVRIRQAALIERPGGWVGAVREIRRALLDTSRQLDGDAAALIPAMAAGDMRLVSKDLNESMRTSSLAHLTAVSGSHMAIIIGVVSALSPVRGRLRLVVIMAVVAAMVCLVGPEPSVVRSAVTTTVTCAGMWLNRGGQALASLAAAIIVMVLLDPWASQSIGFSLSVVATWAVVGPANALSSWAKRRVAAAPGTVARAFGHMVPIAAIPLCCQIATAPLILVMSDGIPVWGAVANIAAAPAVAPATLLSLGAAVTAVPWPGVAEAFAWAASFFTAWIAGVAHAVSSWPAATVDVPIDAFGLACALLCAVAAWAWWVIRRGDADLV